METDRKEALRYLGYGKQPADEAVSRLLEECIGELEKAAVPRFLMREFPLKMQAPDGLDFGGYKTKSLNLSKNLAGCEKALFMAATLGAGADRLLTKYGKLHVAKAAVMQAAAAAMTEAYCNELNGRWREEYKKDGWILRPRFSPGYGDFSLSFQKEILGALEAEKRIGITLTDGFLMMPSKSVTAVIGISKEESPCGPSGSETCEKKDCTFRRQHGNTGRDQKKETYF